MPVPVPDLLRRLTTLLLFALAWTLPAVPALAAEPSVAFVYAKDAPLAELHAFDIAVIDMKMPRMDGIELAGELRADPDLADIRLVLVTSLHSADEVSRARAAGIEVYLSKPVKRKPRRAKPPRHTPAPPGSLGPP